MKREKFSDFTKGLKRKILPQILMQSFIIIAAAVTSFMFMTWFVTDVFNVTDTYVAAGYETLGTLVVFIIVLVPLNTVIYRRRSKEFFILSDSIQRVAGGDYSTRIDCRKYKSIASICEDFNKMCGELESVRILRNDFINSYSHEFKTPIASINGFASLLLDKKLSEEEQRRYLKIIADESARLSKLASNTILLSKLSAQQIVTDTEQYDLSEQIRQCSIILSKSWLDKKIEFSGDFPPAVFNGNKELMQHLWLNLLGNAVKYTPIGGEIYVAVLPANDSITVTVSDTGEGMTEETMEHLFDPYYQGDTSHARQGLGLGLSICRQIAELCGGEIAVQSELGTGSKFTVTLPQK